MSKLDLQLARALSNPLRVQILNSLSEGTASPKQLAKNLDQTLTRVSYHTAILTKTGCIRIAETKRRRAEVEHIYELTPVAASGHLTRRQVPAPVRSHASASILQTIMDRGVAALEAETLDERDDSHLSCMPIVLDEEGWRQVSAIMDEALKRISSAHDASTKRLAAAKGKGISATVAVASFESPES